MIPTWLSDSVTCDLDRALHYTLLWGFGAMELRSIGRHCERVPFVNEAKLRRRLEENEVSVAAIDPGLFTGRADDRAGWMNELAGLSETFSFCTRIGCSRVLVSGLGPGPELLPAAAEALRRAAEAAAKAGVSLIVFHQPGTCAATPADLAALLDAVAHPALRAGWDPAAVIEAGAEPDDALPLLAGRIGYVRCRDVVPGRAGWEPAPFGQGRVGWDRHLVRLASTGFDGPVSLVVEAEPKPREGLRAATFLMNSLRSAASAKPTA